MCVSVLSCACLCSIEYGTGNASIRSWLHEWNAECFGDDSDSDEDDEDDDDDDDGDGRQRPGDIDDDEKQDRN